MSLAERVRMPAPNTGSVSSPLRLIPTQYRRSSDARQLRLETAFDEGFDPAEGMDSQELRTMRTELLEAISAYRQRS